MNTLAIYVFWEKSGIVREYVIKYLEGLKEIASDVVVVVNGELSVEGRHRLEELNVEILVRENTGVDFWAYKTALDVKKNRMSEYDYVLLTNCSNYGPIYPFSEMFDEMNSRPCDFWGITQWPKNEGGYEGTWILSYFIVFKPRVFLSYEWNKYWENLTPVHTREEAIMDHETKFTAYFASKGFRYDVYCKNDPLYIDMTIEAPDKLVIEQRCPIIKRKAFCVDYDRLISYERGDNSEKLFQFLEKSDLFDINVILEDQLATQHYYNIKNTLHLNYFLPENTVVEKISNPPKVALFFHVYYDDLLETSVKYMSAMPTYADIYITTSNEDQIPILEELCNKNNIKNYQIQIVPSRGRADSAFLVNDAKYVSKYDYICVAHDKKSSFLRPGIIGLEFGLQNLDSLLKSKDYVENIIALMEDKPYLGMLTPINLLFSVFRGFYGQEWGANYENVKKMLEEFDIDVPISPDIPPLLPAGAMFWARSESLMKLLDKPWEYSDFEKEPMPVDGGVVHMVERAFPFFVQDSGFLTGWVSSVDDAEIHLTNVSYLFRQDNLKITNYENNGAIIQNLGLKQSFKIYIKKCYHKVRGFFGKIKRRIKRIFS